MKARRSSIQPGWRELRGAVTREEGEAHNDEAKPGGLGAWLHVGDERFDSEKIHRLYESEAYPLQRRTDA